MFEEPTADYQTVTLQGQVTYRVVDPEKLASLMNFTLAPNGRDYVSDDPEKLPQRVINLVHVLARAELEKLPLRDAIRAAAGIVQAVKETVLLLGRSHLAWVGGAGVFGLGDQTHSGNGARPGS